MTAVGPVDEDSFTKGQGKKEFAKETGLQSIVSKETTTSGSGTPTQNIGTGSQAKEKDGSKETRTRPA